jgi:hypothetical protein
MRRTATVGACLLCLPFLSGCLFPYCAYPTIDYTPAVKLDAPPGEVHAFRVDITRPTADMSVFVGPVFERLSELPATNTDEVPAQVKPSVSYGFVVIGIALNYLTHTSHSVALRLYRPGYELVEIKSWQRMNRVAWKPIQDAAAQEQTLDLLLPAERLEPGSVSLAHREALLFGASEYERLASDARSEDLRARLTARATVLRSRATDSKP